MHLQETKTNFQTKYPPSIIMTQGSGIRAKYKSRTISKETQKQRVKIKQNEKIQKGHQNDTLHECPRKISRRRL